LAIVLVGSRFGFAPPWQPTEWSFLAHATMLHATGLSPDKAWNQPSWSVSAEWTAYLAFPVYLAVSGWFRTPAGKLGAAALLFAGLWCAARFFVGVDLLALMNDGGMWRIIPSFFAGVALREVLDSGLGSPLGARPLGALLLATLALIAAGLLLGATTALVWPALSALVYLLALRARSPEGGLMRARPLIWVGDVSYALYLVHAPVLLVAFGLGAKLGGVATPAALAGLGALAILTSMAAAAVAHYAIERPAQSFIVDRCARRRPPAGAAATVR
jgi:peptidoglycan/LPS O-acetylase OafA/YrhL